MAALGRLVDGEGERSGAGPNDVAGALEASDTLGRDLLVVEGEHVAATRELCEGSEVQLGDDRHVGHPTTDGLVTGLGEHQQIDAELDGGVVGHAGELAAPHDPHPGGTRLPG